MAAAAHSGTATYGETLTTTASNTQEGAVLSYEWKSGETVLQAKSTSNTYKIKWEVVGKTITATAVIISKVYNITNTVEIARQLATSYQVFTQKSLLTAKATSLTSMALRLPSHSNVNI